MTIIVDLRPEVQAELARQAASRGSALEDYAATLLEEAAGLPPDATGKVGGSLRDVFEGVRGLADEADFSRNPSIGRTVDLL